jgi:hypothetical protein
MKLHDLNQTNVMTNHNYIYVLQNTTRWTPKAFRQFPGTKFTNAKSNSISHVPHLSPSL